MKTATTDRPQDAPTYTIAFNAGRESLLKGVELEHSTLAKLEVESQQYRDFIAGYDFEAAKHD